MSLSRSSALKLAAVLSFVLSAVSAVLSLTFVVQGAAAISVKDGPPYFVELMLFVTSIIGVIAAYGTWRQMRWGVALTLIISLVNALVAAPGILFGPRPAALIASSVTVLLSVVIIVLCLWRDRRPATA